MVSADAINRQPLVVTVVVGTAARNVPRDYPTNVRVTAKETGLPIDTVLNTHRPNLAGTIPPARMAEVEGALRLVLNL